MTEIAIIDYGVGNLRSVERAFAAGGHNAVITSDPTILKEAKGLVLPGVGAFAACMESFLACGFDEVVRRRVSEGTPLLGICVGMQMLFEQSEEFGEHKGLGLFRGRVRRFSDDLLVPQVGWNQVEKKNGHPVLSGIADHEYFYFVHSYYCSAVEPAIVAGETKYGPAYASVVAHGDLCGVQFHPEKSQDAGLRLLRNFAHRVQFDTWE